MKKLNLKCDLKNELNWNGGITLIALVISIVVLLILAGVSINTLTGENRTNNKSDIYKASIRRIRRKREY